MKTFIRNILMISFVFFGISCDDFLLTESKSSLTEDIVFTNIDHAEKAVLGCYAEMMNAGLWGRNYHIYTQIENDLAYCIGDHTTENRPLTRFLATESNSLLNMWATWYKLIERTNICIENLGPDTPLWNSEYAEDAQRLYGEALTLRALYYYELITHWGDVPWNDKPFKEGDSFYKGKTDRDIIYEQLIADLNEAQRYVPWMRRLGTTERITKGYVRGFRVMLAMQYAGYSLRNGTHETLQGRRSAEYYEIARDEAWRLMESGQHSMYPDYEAYFKSLHQYKLDLSYGETLWELPFGRGYSGQVAVAFGMTFAWQHPKYGNSQSDGLATPCITYYTYDRKDLRRNVNVELYRYAANNTQQTLCGPAGGQFRICKWRKSWIDPPMNGAEGAVNWTGVNYPMMRYTDVVLLFAEAENEVEGYPTERAQEALKMVRRRAFKAEDHPVKVDDYVAAVSESKETFFNAIVDERAWELFGEFKRRNDLVRWDLFGEKIAQMKEACWTIMDFSTPAFQARYKHLVPEYIYWYLDPVDRESLVIYNSDFDPLDASGNIIANWHNTAEARALLPAGVANWTMSAWMPRSNDTQKADQETQLSRIVAGYDPDKNNHLWPIYTKIIDDSNGYLSNDQIP